MTQMIDGYLKEGQKCPCCEKGTLQFYSENCSCHISAPCSSCTRSDLKCDHCGDVFEEGYFDEAEH